MIKRLLLVQAAISLVIVCSTKKLKNEEQILRTRCTSLLKGVKYKAHKRAFVQTISGSLKKEKYNTRKAHSTNEILIFDLSKKLINYKLAFELQNWLHQSKINFQSGNKFPIHSNTPKFVKAKIERFEENLKKYDFCFILQHTPCYTLGSSAHLGDILLDKRNYYIEELGDMYNNFDERTLFQFVNKHEYIKSEIDESENYDEGKNYFDRFSQNGNKVKMPIYRINRGGKVTYHGPGQLILYFILDLKRYPCNYSERGGSHLSQRKDDYEGEQYQMEEHNEERLPHSCNTNLNKKTESSFDLHKTVNNIQKVGVEILDKFKIKAHTKENSIGVFYKDKKLISIGVKIRKYISMHGMALNFNLDKNFLKYLLPCGMSHTDYTSMHELDEVKIRERRRTGVSRNPEREREMAISSTLLNELALNCAHSLGRIFNAKVKISSDIGEVFA
ncbi:lipoate-protein ligase B, putative [Plasmodium knowlesi strain H]|uniref:Lipoate-protein ligase B, putative n=3 Tax=Plasmodium knowlesi TaxID=5850 RepID=A0A5K1VG72_PLAKH|nr:lipoate-protein ligase B, putative [Plasmodium knowlesi strain H]OTN67902.1 putative Lipoate-protein ligase B [Plasmodium knowlesi]CAA9990214.1 lipoate-protein ligase B, putative [Plasmodium knowlesi strain H]SBO26849.1 lipoate-protein ligase B, putative [Plasmodium knowlesi strain H]SBO28462.1 lipoate-protein ligase B, putative [Plasmodium knowlesi strain H]VVS79688.1 lipoate-protein ligase B, putative [Plasmodium knowlesi strain H]|eukprot:XP_002258087.1 lipoate-protein ligase, putative [Plasmodium knowlesi strain H]